MWISAIILDGSDNQLVDFGWREWVSRGCGISRDSTPKIGTKAAPKNRYSLILFSSCPQWPAHIAFIQSCPARSELVSAPPPTENMSKSSFPGKILILFDFYYFILKAHRQLFSTPNNVFPSSLRKQGLEVFLTYKPLWTLSPFHWNTAQKWAHRPSSHHGQRQGGLSGIQEDRSKTSLTSLK